MARHVWTGWTHRFPYRYKCCIFAIPSSIDMFRRSASSILSSCVLPLFPMRPNVEERIYCLWQQRGDHATDTPPVSDIRPVFRYVDISPYEHHKRCNAPKISRNPRLVSARFLYKENTKQDCRLHCDQSQQIGISDDNVGSSVFNSPLYEVELRHPMI